MGLDLSFNNFEGQVPRTGIFRNSSALFLSGNSKLIGGINELHFPRCPANSIALLRLERRERLSHVVIIIIAISCFAASISIALSMYLIYSKRKGNDLSKGSLIREPLPKVSYGMIQKATDGFSEGNLLSTVHFCFIYKGVLVPDIMVVAIKVIRLEQQRASKSFIEECKALRNIRHRSLVEIVTACSSIDFDRNDFKALVYVFMSNGNIHNGYIGIKMMADKIIHNLQASNKG